MPSDLASLTEADVISLWIRRNRGICADLSREFDVSREFVRQILYGLPGGRSEDFGIEKALIAAGAPFVADRISGVA